MRRPSLILGLEEIWRGVLKSKPGFPFLSPRRDFAPGIQPRFIFIRFPHRRVSISFVISRARREHDSLRFLCSNLFLFLLLPCFPLCPSTSFSLSSPPRRGDGGNFSCSCRKLIASSFCLFSLVVLINRRIRKDEKWKYYFFYYYL